MSNMCFDLNPNCLAKAEGEAKQPCPSFEKKISCWALDWKPLMENISEEQKKIMGEWVKENCPRCPVYGKHGSEIDAKINAITR